MNSDDTNNLNPLDKILTARQLANDDLVKASREQLTFKQIHKARVGKNITPNIKGKVLRALNACATGSKYTLSDIFPADSIQS